VFDVGANIGQSAQRFMARFPVTGLHCFEPVADTFGQLVENMAGDARVRCHQVALGSKDETALITADARSTGNRIIAGRAATSHAVESVTVRTGDGFCRDYGIEKISFLKIDTEGHDLQVIAGFAEMLRRQQADLIQVEAGMNHLNRRHVPLAEIMAFLAPLGYVLFGLYDQVHERKGRPFLRRTNAVFVALRTVDENTTTGPS
jgi:FkbM family methyltransferase